MRIFGTIQNSTNGEPVKGAMIKLSINDDKIPLILSDEKGRFEHKTEVESLYQTLNLSVEKDGFSSKSFSYEIDKPEIQADILLEKIIKEPVPVEPIERIKWYIQIKNFLSTNTSIVIKFLIDQITEYRKKMGDNKEVEVLKNKLGTYKEKTELRETELDQVEDIIKKMESTLGSGYISENAFVNWNFDKIKPKMSAFNIDVWIEEGDYQEKRDITTVQKQKTEKNYLIGNKINLYFKSEKDCYLTLWNYGTSGKLTVLFPNALFQNNFIEGNRIHAIPGKDYPFDYILSGPPGIERIKAIASTHKFNLIDLTFKKGEIFSTSRSATRDISVAAKKIENKELDEWAEAMCEIKVV